MMHSACKTFHALHPFGHHFLKKHLKDTIVSIFILIHLVVLYDLVKLPLNSLY